MMITGEMVLLRAIEHSDIRQLWEWTQDAETMRLRNYMAPPTSFAEAEKEYEESLATADDHVHLAVATKENELIGEASLHDINRRTQGAQFTIAIGNKAYWGKGYGSDATKALMRYAFEQLNLHRITLFVHDFNARAIKAYEKCGFKHEGRLREAEYMDGKFSDILVMGILRGEDGVP